MLALKPTMLLLDEPASGISQKETEALGPLLRDIKETDRRHDPHDRARHAARDGPVRLGVLPRRRHEPLARARPRRCRPIRWSSRPTSARPTERTQGARPRRSRCEPTLDDREVLLEVPGLDVFYGKVQVLDERRLPGPPGRARRAARHQRRRQVDDPQGGLRPHPDRRRAPSAGRARTSPACRPSSSCGWGLGQVPGGRGLFPTPDRDREPAHGRLHLQDEKQRHRGGRAGHRLLPVDRRARRPARRARCRAASSSSWPSPGR